MKFYTKYLHNFTTWNIFLLLIKSLGYCSHCGQFFVYPKRRRMNTAYVDEESNYCTYCEDCFEEIEAHWADMWNDYYRSR